MITDTEARKIASEWEGKSSETFTPFVQDGSIVNTSDMLYVIGLRIGAVVLKDYSTHATERLYDLMALRKYVKHHGTRGPVEGWSKLSW